VDGAMMGAACVLHGIGQAVGWAKRRSRWDGWKCSEAERAVCVWVKWTCAWKKKEKEGAVPAADRVSNRTAHGGALWMGSDEDY
jgi:hypothetical protein